MSVCSRPEDGIISTDRCLGFHVVQQGLPRHVGGLASLFYMVKVVFVILMQTELVDKSRFHSTVYVASFILYELIPFTHCGFS